MKEEIHALHANNTWSMCNEWDQAQIHKPNQALAHVELNQETHDIAFVGKFLVEFSFIPDVALSSSAVYSHLFLTSTHAQIVSNCSKNFASLGLYSPIR